MTGKTAEWWTSWPWPWYVLLTLGWATMAVLGISNDEATHLVVIRVIATVYFTSAAVRSHRRDPRWRLVGRS